ncbi:BZ3500_MvSof-1268-A1-R1_Chr5-2g08022 [Microbotryum saponariae]|uniref:BZ3500_MvSof-1268-A1-R1_Chr5-2g08022 protein n=1 Tax=Microbotryum saponariae TaxID=289078 RepID=A0A2X0LG49_9BASI|nr:BZ3500_MvSof-1268-A1-R1_Chr5-2g08022 [Microbotryum saponariae]SDA05891.1 BZ3501_MvSof-1269-A2-R1_Chr5-2g07844 [Microbotryum saponariae]
MRVKRVHVLTPTGSPLPSLPTGIWSPAAYDALLLEKIKMMLSSHLNSPKHATIRTTYEQFVLDLDVQDEGSKNAVKSLIRETVVRRRLLPHSQPSHPPTVAEPALTSDPRSGLLFGSSARTSAAASTSNEPALQLEAASRAASNAWTTTSASSGRETRIHAPSGPIISIAPRRSTTGAEAATLSTTRVPRSARSNDATDLQTTLNDDPRLSWQQFLSESTGGDQSAFETTLGSSFFIPNQVPTPSTRENDGLPRPGGHNHHNNDNGAASPPSTRPTLRTIVSLRPRPPPPLSLQPRAPPPPRVATLRPPPTAEQIWSTLFDDVPFPLDDLVHIPFEVFLLSLNEVMNPPIAHATTFSNLCDELQCRDPGFNTRLRRIQRGESASRLLYQLRNVANSEGGGMEGRVSVEEATREDRERERGRGGEGRERERGAAEEAEADTSARADDARENVRRFMRETAGNDDEDEEDEEGEDNTLRTGPFFDPDFNYDQDMSDSLDAEEEEQVANAEENFREYSSRLRSLWRSGAYEWVQEVLRVEEAGTSNTGTEDSTPVLEATTTAATSTNVSPPPMVATTRESECPPEGSSPRRSTLSTSMPTPRSSAEIAEAAQRANRRIRPIPSRPQAIPTLSSYLDTTTTRRPTPPATDANTSGPATMGALRRRLRLDGGPELEGDGMGGTRWTWSDRGRREEGRGEGADVYPRFSTRMVTMTESGTGNGRNDDDAGEDVYEGSRVFHL